MNTRNSYIFLEQQYINLPIPQEILNERGSDLDPLITGQDEGGNDIITPRTPQNTTIWSALNAYKALKPVNGISPIKRYWYDGENVPTLLKDGENAPLHTVKVQDGEMVEQTDPETGDPILDEEGNPILVEVGAVYEEQERTDGKVFILVGIPNFTFDESNAMKSNMDMLIDPNVAAQFGLDPVAVDFKPWLSHKQALQFIREGVV